MRRVVSRSRVVIASLLIVVVIGSWWVVRHMQGSARGTIIQHAQPISMPTPDKLMAGKNVSFRYPARLQSVRTPTPTGTTLETFSFIGSQVPVWNMSVEIMPLPGGRLNDLSAYQYRTLQRAQYTPETLQVGNQPITVMAATSGGFNKVAFLVHGERAATIALSCASAASEDELQNVLKTVIANWQWV